MHDITDTLKLHKMAAQHLQEDRRSFEPLPSISAAHCYHNLTTQVGDLTTQVTIPIRWQVLASAEEEYQPATTILLAVSVNHWSRALCHAMRSTD